MDEPLDTTEAERLIRSILENGVVRFSGHAEDEMENDELEKIDCKNVLRAGWVEPPEWENGSWRYRVCSHKITVVVAFRSESQLVVVTVWRV